MGRAEGRSHHRGRAAPARPLAFPFAAIAGQAAVKRALLLAVVNPRVGGVLLLGEKGTAKSTAVRGLTALLPEIAVVPGCPFNCDPAGPAGLCPRCRAPSAPGPAAGAVRRPVPLVEVPLSADLERVVGSLRLESAIRLGRVELEPGLLAAAHRGILYVDEVNLLDERLAAALLDAAASGVNVVQRDGIAVAHPARFLLVGTMNPEEGELGPQLLDRFGLAVTVRGEADPEVRVEVLRRRAAFDADPASFVRRWAAIDARVRRRLEAARERLPAVRMSEPALARAVEVAKWAGTAGHRAEIAIAEAARALAAWRGRTTVSPEEVEEVSELALAHRAASGPSSGPGVHAARAAPAAAGSAPDPGEDGPARGVAGDGPVRVGALRPVAETGPAADRPAAVRPGEVRGPAGRPRPLARAGRGGWTGRSALVSAAGGRGRYLRPTAERSGGDLALDATLRAAAPHQRRRRREGVAVVIEPRDLREKVRARRAGSLLLFVVDGSGSMAGGQRMAEARAAVLTLLVDAYRKRDRVGLVVFRHERAEVLLPPTNSVELAQRRLRGVPTGGRTPLAAGLAVAGEVARAHGRRHPAAPVRLILLTDGRANVGLGGDPLEDACRVAEGLRAAGVESVVIDVAGRGAGGSAANRRLAAALGARHLRVEELRAERLLEVVRGWTR